MDKIIISPTTYFKYEHKYCYYCHVCAVTVLSLFLRALVNICLLFLQYEYFNAVLINEVDEEGNNVELGGEFLLEPNYHFNNLSVNLSLSVVQVPTNMYNKGVYSSSLQLP